MEHEEAPRGAPMPEAWVPQPGVTGHDGKPLPPDVRFFAAPPPQIGEVLSAESTSRKGGPVWTAKARLAVVAGLFTVLALLPLGAMLGEERPEDRRAVAPFVYAGGFAAPVISLIFLINTRAIRVATFVGTRGVATAEARGSRSVPRTTKFVFKPTYTLKSDERDLAEDGGAIGVVVRHTVAKKVFSYSWHDKRDLCRYTITNAKSGLAPPVGITPSFAEAAARAWQGFLREEGGAGAPGDGAGRGRTRRGRS